MTGARSGAPPSPSPLCGPGARSASQWPMPWIKWGPSNPKRTPPTHTQLRPWQLQLLTYIRTLNISHTNIHIHFDFVSVINTVRTHDSCK
jgi:hypothetical protein